MQRNFLYDGVVLEVEVIGLAVPTETLIRQFHRNDSVLTQLLLYHLHHPHDRAATETGRQ